MALDANIILRGQNQQPMNLSSMYRDAMQIKDFKRREQEALQNKEDKQAMSDILRKNTITDASGRTSLNRQGALSDMYKHNPNQAMNYEEIFAKNDLSKLKRDHEATSQLIWSATPENWGQVKRTGIEYGLTNFDKLPDDWNPDFVGRMKVGLMDGGKQLDMQFRQQKLELQKEANDISRMKYERGLEEKALEKKNKLSEGQKAVDKDFAKDFNDWTSGGASIAKSEIQKLKGVVKDIKDGNVSLGRENALVPDLLADNDRLAARADVQSTVMNSLRAILGAQFTEKEGERIIKNTWNEDESEENNVKRLERLVSDLESQAMAKDAKAIKYQEDGTLSGFRYSPSESQGTRVRPPETRIYNTNEIEWLD